MKKKISKRAINSALPYLQTLDRWYVFQGDSGQFPEGSQTVASAFMEYDLASGDCEAYIYAVGEAMESRHYYGETDTVDIEDILRRYQDRRLNRQDAVDEIHEAISKDVWKKSLTLEDIAAAMINGSDHSDISEGWENVTCTYYFDLEDDRLSVDAKVDPEIVPDAEEMRDLMCEDRSEYDNRVDRFLGDFDSSFETLENDYFKDAVEEMLQMIREYD